MGASDGDADTVVERVGNQSALGLTIDVVLACSVVSSIAFHQPEFPFTGFEAYSKNTERIYILQICEFSRLRDAHTSMWPGNGKRSGRVRRGCRSRQIPKVHHSFRGQPWTPHHLRTPARVSYNQGTS